MKIRYGMLWRLGKEGATSSSSWPQQDFLQRYTSAVSGVTLSEQNTVTARYLILQVFLYNHYHGSPTQTGQDAAEVWLQVF